MVSKPVTSNNHGWYFSWAVLLAAQLAGEGVVALTGILVPGPVLGAVFLCLAFFVVPGLHAAVAPLCAVLVRNMLLLYVPASVGIAWVLPQLQEGAVAIALAVTLGTWVTAAVSAWTFSFLQRRPS